MLGYQEVLMSQTSAVGGVKNVVLVHGGFVDGSGWQGVYDTLKKDGYSVSIVQNPTMSLADDVAVTKRTLAAQNGAVILVGHSYDRRPDDSAGRAAGHVETRGLNRRRGGRKSRGIRVAAGGGGQSHRKGSEQRRARDELAASKVIR